MLHTTLKQSVTATNEVNIDNSAVANFHASQMENAYEHK